MSEDRQVSQENKAKQNKQSRTLAQEADSCVKVALFLTCPFYGVVEKNTHSILHFLATCHWSNQIPSKPNFAYLSKETLITLLLASQG